MKEEKNLTTEGVKFDQGKHDWSLIPFEIMGKVVEIFQYGLKKYSKNNWQKIQDPRDRYFSALMRHLVSWQSGEERDGESGLEHLAHACTNIIILMWHEENQKKQKSTLKDNGK